MQITEARVKLSETNSRALAFASLTFDNELAVHDLKLIDGNRGLFVAMPNRRIMDSCGECGKKNCVQASFCNFCGCRLGVNRCQVDERGQPILYADICHPITPLARRLIEQAVIESYEIALKGR